MPRRVTEYLRKVYGVTASDVEAQVRDLTESRQRLAAFADDRPADVAKALAHLAKKRLLASNSLRHANPIERAAWDEANVWTGQLVAKEPPVRWSLGELKSLHAVLTGGPARLRSAPIYSCEQEYLALEDLDAELAKLEAHVQAGEHDPLLVAATTYIAVVTIHPFDNANGRTARLTADRLLLQDGYLPLCFLSPVASHVAQMQSGPTRDPQRSVRLVLRAVAESYATVFGRLDAGP